MTLTDIFLKPGESTTTDIKLVDPTTAPSPVSVAHNMGLLKVG